jgi:hypothetical protein
MYEIIYSIKKTTPKSTPESQAPWGEGGFLG